MRLGVWRAEVAHDTVKDEMITTCWQSKLLIAPL